MIFVCPFLPCKALRTAMYKRYINSIIIIINKKKNHLAALPNREHGLLYPEFQHFVTGGGG